jgi:hypothetical protein
LPENSKALSLRAPRPAAVFAIVSNYSSKVVPDAPTYYRDATSSFDAKPNAELDLKITLEPTDLLILKGRVIDAEGRPVKGAKLFLFSGNASDTWTDQAIPNFRGGSIKISEDRMLVSATTDADGKYQLKTVRFDGEVTKAGTRYSIGVVIGDEGKKLVPDIVLSPNKRERNVEIQLD